MGFIQTGILEVENLQIPYYLRTERRANVRYSVGRNKVNIKLPFYYTKSMVKGELKKVAQWLSIQVQQNDRLRSKFELKNYEITRTIDVLGTTYSLEIEESALKSNYIKLLSNQVLHIRLEKKLDKIQTHDVIQRLLSKVFANIYKEQITQMVLDINDKYFHEAIQSVRLKYNKSNWGSCSSKRNINLSTRLLLATDPSIIKYVIVHELAHLKEMNHSSAFWRIVSNVMPDYKRHERWLKVNGHLLDF